MIFSFCAPDIYELILAKCQPGEYVRPIEQMPSGHLFSFTNDSESIPMEVWEAIKHDLASYILSNV